MIFPKRRSFVASDLTKLRPALDEIALYLISENAVQPHCHITLKCTREVSDSFRPALNLDVTLYERGKTPDSPDKEVEVRRERGKGTNRR